MHTLRFYERFAGQIIEGRKHATFREGPPPAQPGEAVRLVSDGPSGVLIDTALVWQITPVAIDRTDMIEGRIASICVAGEFLNRWEVEAFAILDGFGSSDGTGQTARARMGAFYDSIWPGTRRLEGFVTRWVPRGGMDQVNNTLVEAILRAQRTVRTIKPRRVA